MSWLRLKLKRDAVFITTLVIVLCAYWSALHWPSLSYGWNWDDYHSIRRFTRAELVHAFSATYDPDGYENAGLRPFTVLFNHFRAVVIGEHPTRQRLFILGLAACSLWIEAWLCLQLGLRRRAVALGLLILVSTKVFSAQIAWLTDGIFVFQTLVCGLALVGMVFLVRRNSWLAAALSLLAAWIALWTREDSLAIFLIMPVLFLCCYWQTRRVSRLSTLLHTWKGMRGKASLLYVTYFGCLAVVVAVTMMYRAVAVPSAAPLPTSAAAFKGLLKHLEWSAWIVGEVPLPGWAGSGFQSGSPVLARISEMWGLALASTPVVVLVLLRKDGAFLRRLALCSICMVLTATPGMVFARPNLIYFPTFFFVLLLAILLTRIWSKASIDSMKESVIGDRLRAASYYGARLWVILVCIVAVAGSSERAVLQDLDMHPLSLGQIWRDFDMVYGSSSRHHPTIPGNREHFLIDKLQELGLTPGVARDPDVFEAYFRETYWKALNNSRFYPAPGRPRPFVAPVNFQSP